MNPLTMQQGYGAARTSLLSLGATAVVAGKPFVLSEWNEYGAYPFHSTAFVQMAAYACLNDWDGLILYAHHTSEKWDNQPPPMRSTTSSTPTTIPPSSVPLPALPLDGKPFSKAKEVLLTAVGETGMDETTQSPVEFFPGVPFTACAFQGKLYADTWEGSLTIAGDAALTALDVYGSELGTISGEAAADGTRFNLTGGLLATAYLLKRN